MLRVCEVVHESMGSHHHHTNVNATTNNFHYNVHRDSDRLSVRHDVRADLLLLGSSSPHHRTISTTTTFTLIETETSIDSSSTTITAYTSSTIIYAACATANFADKVSGQNINDFQAPVIIPDENTYLSQYFVTALTRATSAQNCTYPPSPSSSPTHQTPRVLNLQKVGTIC